MGSPHPRTHPGARWREGCAPRSGWKTLADKPGVPRWSLRESITRLGSVKGGGTNRVNEVFSRDCFDETSRRLGWGGLRGLGRREPRRPAKLRLRVRVRSVLPLAAGVGAALGVGRPSHPARLSVLSDAVLQIAPQKARAFADLLPTQVERADTKTNRRAEKMHQRDGAAKAREGMHRKLFMDSESRRDVTLRGKTPRKLNSCREQDG